MEKANPDFQYDSNSLSSIDDLAEEAESLFYYYFYSLWPGDLNIFDRLLALDDFDWKRERQRSVEQIHHWFKKMQDEKHII